MSKLRDRCEQLAIDLPNLEGWSNKDIDVIESFAREIRNEALEDAAGALDECNDAEYAEYVRALKEPK